MYTFYLEHNVIVYKGLFNNRWTQDEGGRCQKMFVFLHDEFFTYYEYFDQLFFVLFALHLTFNPNSDFSIFDSMIQNGFKMASP